MTTVSEELRERCRRVTLFDEYGPDVSIGIYLIQSRLTPDIWADKFCITASGYAEAVSLANSWARCQGYTNDDTVRVIPATQKQVEFFGLHDERVR